MYTELADLQEQTYCNINHGGQILLEGDYDSPDILSQMLHEDDHIDGSQYDNPTSLDLVSKKERNMTTEIKEDNASCV